MIFVAIFVIVVVEIAVVFDIAMIVIIFAGNR